MTSVSQSLQLTQAQRLAMTPALRQAIALLQLTSLELSAQVEQIVESNPLLSVEEPCEQEPMDPPPQSTQFDDPVGVAAEFEREAAFITWSSTVNHDDDDDPSPFETIASNPTLSEHLLEQLGCMNPDKTTRALVTWLIGNLDENGLLTESLESCAADCPIQASPREWHTAYNLLRSFDPAGVGARNTTEVLELQLKAINFDNPTPTSVLALALIKNGLEALAKRDFRSLAEKFDTPPQAVAEALECISHLDPHPAARFADTRSCACIIPEVFVVRTPKGWKAKLNPQAVPRLRFDHESYELLTAAKLGKEARCDWKNKALEAKAFVHALEQRFSTIVSVAQTIVDAQCPFFENGPSALSPMGLKDIAQSLGIAESTVSRATAGKYMQTPQGTFELKSFFTSSVAGADGGTVSSTAVRKRIREIVASENPAKPLSDAAIAQTLEKEGICVARRTVAKYRELDNIAPKQLRRRA